MKQNKSPGLDGITTEFYQTFWPLIGKLVVDSFNESYHIGKLTDSQRKCVISLIYKKGDKEDISNYRPISLTNNDYRLLAFTLAERLQKVMNTLVSSDQSAYIKKRYMGTNIRLVSDIIDYYDTFDKSGILMTVDFKKAFDSVEWNFLFKSLQFFNFGPSFIKWIETIYYKPEACIKNNGYLSNYFDISRGVRQGCPVSALLFVLCVEILGIKMRNTDLLNGFDFGYNKAIKIAQYADDSVLFLNNRNEMCSALNLLRKFGYVSGLALNTEKCEGFWLGADKKLQIHCSMFGIKWPPMFRYLGIFMSHNKDQSNSKNFDEKINRINEILKKWANRNLSLFGKVQILKAYALSQLTLPATTLCVPKDLAKVVNKIFHTFLWGKLEKVKRKKIIQRSSEGGLNMVDVQLYLNSLSASWISRIRESDPNSDQWVQIPNVYLKSIEIDDIGLLFNFDETVEFKNIENLPLFYKQAVRCYNTAFACNRTEFEETIMNQTLWGNKYITYNMQRKKNVLFLRNWIRSGVRKVKDLQFKDGVLDVNQTYHQIISKQNIYCEINLVRKALIPFKAIINQNNSRPINPVRPFKSQLVYNSLKEKLLLNSRSPYEKHYLLQFCTIEEINVAFSKKVADEKEIKLKEYNFKLLHGILPCNLNLRKWKIRTDDSCDLCGNTQSIEHLLYSCIYIQPLWGIINNIFGLSLSYRQILGLDKQFKHDFVTTIVSFIIYKHWLLLSLEHKKRCRAMLLPYFKSELLLRLEIYKLCKSIAIENVEYLERMSLFFSQM